MPVLDRVAVEIDVRIEVLSGPVLVGAAAEVPGIVEKVVDSGQPADQIEERARLDQVIQFRIGTAELANAFDGGLAAELAGLVARVAALERGELREQAFFGARMISESRVLVSITSGAAIW